MGIKMRLLLLVSLLIIIPSPRVIADPGASLRMLKSTPISLLDWGLAKLNQRLDGLNVTGVGKIRIVATFDTKQSRIWINGRSFRSAGDSGEARNWCQQTIVAIRHALGVNPDTGKPATDSSTTLGNYFSDGVETHQLPATLHHDLEEMTLLQAAYEVTNGGKMVTCQANLLGSDIAYQQ